jgi:predicted DCC family thiol-disulfide oxidoreductase YuxK
MTSEPPLLIYDGDCQFCMRWIARWRRWTGERVRYEASQAVAQDYPQIPAARFRESVVLVEHGGRISYGAEAVARSLAVRAAGRALLVLYLYMPGARAVAEHAYRWVARRRGRWPVR